MTITLNGQEIHAAVDEYMRKRGYIPKKDDKGNDMYWKECAGKLSITVEVETSLSDGPYR